MSNEFSPPSIWLYRHKRVKSACLTVVDGKFELTRDPILAAQTLTAVTSLINKEDIFYHPYKYVFEFFFHDVDYYNERYHSSKDVTMGLCIGDFQLVRLSEN